MSASSWWDKYVTGYFRFLLDNYYIGINDIFATLTKLITTVPIDLIAHENAMKLQAIFIGYSLVVILILATVEGYKALLGLSYTKPTVLFGRIFVALIGASLTFPAIVWLAKSANLAVVIILSLSDTYFSGSQELGSMLREFSASGTINFFASVIFMLAFLYFIFFALFRVGRRWFDLLMNMVTSPFAWAAYVTDGTSKYLTMFISTTGKLILVNVVYAFYVVVISVIVMAPGEVQDFSGWMARMLLLLGGLWSLSSPPAWITNMDSPSMLPSIKKMLPRGRKKADVG